MSNRSKMLFLVAGKWEEAFREKMKEEGLRYWREYVQPCLASLANMNATKKITGGVTGQQAIFTVDLPSRGDVLRMLATLPHWGRLKWQVTPLETFQKASSSDRTMTKTGQPGSAKQ
jgi:hypothetical protein